LGDLAGHYLSAYDPATAWELFDLGRAIDPNWRTGVVGGVAPLEQRLRTDAPDYF
jgi:hypothetical protein